MVYNIFLYPFIVTTENNYLGQPILNPYATNLKPLYMFRHAYYSGKLLREISYYKFLEVITNSHMMSYALL